MPKSNLFQLPASTAVGQKLSSQFAAQQAGFGAFVHGQIGPQKS